MMTVRGHAQLEDAGQLVAIVRIVRFPQSLVLDLHLAVVSALSSFCPFHDAHYSHCTSVSVRNECIFSTTVSELPLLRDLFIVAIDCSSSPP